MHHRLLSGEQCRAPSDLRHRAGDDQTVSESGVPGGRGVALAGTATATGSASGALTFVAMARGVAEAVGPSALSTADVPTIVAAVVAEMDRRRDPRDRRDWREWREN